VVDSSSSSSFTLFVKSGITYVFIGSPQKQVESFVIRCHGNSEAALGTTLYRHAEMNTEERDDTLPWFQPHFGESLFVLDGVRKNINKEQPRRSR
jgi:hypothetical protein